MQSTLMQKVFLMFWTVGKVGDFLLKDLRNESLLIWLF
jgi:hypothetical protein